MILQNLQQAHDAGYLHGLIAGGLMGGILGGMFGVVIAALLGAAGRADEHADASLPAVPPRAIAPRAGSGSTHLSLL